MDKRAFRGLQIIGANIVKNQDGLQGVIPRHGGNLLALIYRGKQGWWVGDVNRLYDNQKLKHSEKMLWTEVELWIES